MTYEALSTRIRTINHDVNMRQVNHEEVDALLMEAKRLDHMNARVYLMIGKGQLHFFEGHSKEAYDAFFDAYTLAEQINNMDAFIDAQMRIGNTYTSLGLYEHAFQYLMRAHENAMKHKFADRLAVLYVNMGTCLFKQDMIEEAGQYCLQGYEALKDHENLFYRFFTTLNLAVYLMRIGELDQAEMHLKETNIYLDKIPQKLHHGLDANYARLEAYRGHCEASLKRMESIYDVYFRGQVELVLYDQILEWCHILKKHNKAHLSKSILERAVNDIQDKEAPAAADLMLLLAELYEKELNYQKASELYSKSVHIKTNQYRKNQQFITHNTLKLIDMTRQNQEMAERTYRDAMTSCFNRYALNAEGQGILDQGNQDKGIAVIMFDVDYFKQYNDYYGHQEGDQCIIVITEAIQGIFPDETRYFYRYGGDEFLILWPIQAQTAETIAFKLLQTVRDLKLPHAQSPVAKIATISVGVSTSALNNTELQGAIDAADMNLYMAKFNKRNCASIDEVLLEQ